MFQTIKSRLYAIIFVTICIVAGLGAAAMFAVRWQSAKMEQITQAHLPYIQVTKKLHAQSNNLSFHLLHLTTSDNPPEANSHKQHVLEIITLLHQLSLELTRLEGAALANAIRHQVSFLEKQTLDLHAAMLEFYANQAARDQSMNDLDGRLAEALHELEVLRQPHDHGDEHREMDEHELNDLELQFSHLHETLGQITREDSVQDILALKASYERALVKVNKLLNGIRNKAHETHMAAFDKYSKAYDLMRMLPDQQIAFLKSRQNATWLSQESLQNVGRLRQATETLSQSAEERAGSLDSEIEGLRIQSILIVMLMTIGAVVILLLTATQIMGSQVLGRIETLRDNLKGSKAGDLLRIPLDGQDELAMIAREIELTHRTVAELRETALDQDRAVRNAMDQADHALSELRTTQRSLIQSEKMASMAPLFAAVAHEVSTPLGAAVGVATHLAQRVEKFGVKLGEGKLSDTEIKSFYEFVAEGASLLDANIQRTIELADRLKQSSSQHDLDDRQLVHFQDFLEEMAQTKRTQFKERGIEVAIHCPDNMEVSIHTGAMTQILTTLLINSVAHAFEDGQKGLITIMAGVEPTSGDLTLTYSDNGRGMSEQEKHRIFDPYYQSQKGDEGSGLGMLLVYSIVTVRMNGSIDVQSLPGEGVKFEIQIPTNNHSRSKNNQTSTPS